MSSLAEALAIGYASGTMGFDTALLKQTLEQFVEQIDEGTQELILERPRFAYAVVVVADDQPGELCQAECVRMLDSAVETQPAVSERRRSSTWQFRSLRIEPSGRKIECEYETKMQTNNEYIDEEILRALRELEESRDMLSDDIEHAKAVDNNNVEKVTRVVEEVERTSRLTHKTALLFPSEMRHKTTL